MVPIQYVYIYIYIYIYIQGSGNLEPYIHTYLAELMNTTWSNGDLRLVGVGSTGVSGRLEIFIETGETSAGEEGEWGTVCGDTFTMREANVACRQLGYHGASNWTFATNAL